MTVELLTAALARDKDMRITLHWWAVPLLLILIAAWFMYRPKKGAFYGPDFSDAGDALIAISCFVAAIAFVFGHFAI